MSYPDHYGGTGAAPDDERAPRRRARHGATAADSLPDTWDVSHLGSSWDDGPVDPYGRSSADSAYPNEFVRPVGDVDRHDRRDFDPGDWSLPISGPDSAEARARLTEYGATVTLDQEEPPVRRPRGARGRRRAGSRAAAQRAAAVARTASVDKEPSAGTGQPRNSAQGGKRAGGRAGRNLPAAIGVGVGLVTVVAASLFVWRPAFLGVLVVAVGAGIWEMSRAVRSTGARPPMSPLIAGGALMGGLAWFAGPDALCLGLLVTVLASMVWRLADGPAGYQRDLTMAALIAVYVPFLAGFAAMLASPDDGEWRVLVTLAAVVLSDTGGYAFGVFFGKHPMAPRVSPKKSWEGLGGSLLATALGSAILLFVLWDVAIWWGAAFGLAISAAAVLGDLTESMIKRDLGVKDMSNLLPGHGGIMDRLDSILFAVPTAYLLLTVLVPTGG